MKCVCLLVGPSLNVDPRDPPILTPCSQVIRQHRSAADTIKDIKDALRGGEIPGTSCDERRWQAMTGNERRWGAMRVVMSFDLYIWWRQWKYDRWFAYWMAIADSLRAGWHIALNNIHVSWFCQSLRHILRDTHLTLSHQSHTCSSYFQFTPLQAWGYNCEYNVCF